MIESLHVASGAAAGAALRSRTAAVVAGPVLHILGDLIPHQDIASRGFEVGSGVLGVLFVAARRGPTDAATIGALAASAPDIEHVVKLPRPGGRKLFPSHRLPGWHRPGGVPAWAQLLAAGALLGIVLSAPIPSGAGSPP